jgi:hypothetical protein
MATNNATPIRLRRSAPGSAPCGGKKKTYARAVLRSTARRVGRAPYHQAARKVAGKKVMNGS